MLPTSQMESLDIFQDVLKSYKSHHIRLNQMKEIKNVNLGYLSVVITSVEMINFMNLMLQRFMTNILLVIVSMICLIKNSPKILKIVSSSSATEV
jgi:hypothetical protein